MTTQITVNVGSKELYLESGRLAKLSNGAVVARIGETMVLAAADAAPEAREGADFFPLTIDYRERMYAAGKIPGGFFKREGRPSEHEILTCRLIDRPIRSLFGKKYRNEVQIMAMTLSADGNHPADVLAMNASAAALAISSIPFEAVMGAIRVGRVNGQLIANPTFEEIEQSTLELVVAATRDEVVMIECGAREVPEADFLAALRFAHDHIRRIVSGIEELKKKCGKKKAAIEAVEIPEEIRKKVTAAVGSTFDEINQPARKEERGERVQALWKKVLASFDPEAGDYDEGRIKSVFEELEYASVRALILKNKQRTDGRAFDQIRQLSCEVGVLPRTHGSALFTRGQTQSLGVATLGTGDDEQRIDALEGEAFKHFMLHYNFPAFSVGEVRPNRGVGRREVGHGALAERALRAIAPSKEEFPYTIRLVSDILESNGSSSMASVCSCCLALMDAGVPITAPVAGIAMGLVADGKNYAILTDIAGVEDHMGDMDFKVAGTAQGITAVQVDLKIGGLAYEIIEKTLEQARRGRHFILDFMSKTMQAPRTELSKYAPRFTEIQINPEKIKIVIGPSGKMIKEITRVTGAKIDISDDGKVQIFAGDAEKVDQAVGMIRDLTQEAEIGKTYKGKVKRLMNFGAFCEIVPGIEGLVHVSELCDEYVSRVDDVVKIGDEFPVKVIEIDEQGRVNLSAKQAAAGLKIRPGAAAQDTPGDGFAHRGGRDRHRGDRPRHRDREHARPPRRH